MATSSALELIPAGITCRFVGEGRANLVFTLDPTDAALHPSLQGHLLRLPKKPTSTGSSSNSKALPYPDLQHYWETRIQPLFKPHELVHQRLVRLPPTPDDRASFLRGLNAQLRALDASGTRRPDFLGHVVADDVQIGMLVEDMRSSIINTSPDGTPAAIMHEIKPKWLHQSPRAPRGAEQCRNCAREVWRNQQNATRKPIFCPLNLVKAADFPGDEGVARDIAAELRRCFVGSMTDAEAWTLARWLRGSELFVRLRRIQWENDHSAQQVGNDEAYSLAMTLRDCSLFVLVPTTGDGDGVDAAPRVVAKLGDTDMKNFAVKKDYWLKMEQKFHDSGVYWNSDKLSMSLTACQLPFYRDRIGSKVDSELGRYYLV